MTKDEMKNVQAMKEFPQEALPTAALTLKRCIVAMAAAADHCDQESISGREKRKRCQIAFKLQMPPLDQRESIRAYIACVAHGITLRVFSGAEASQLLYAAQVALTLVRTEQKQKPAARRPRGSRKQEAA